MISFRADRVCFPSLLLAAKSRTDPTVDITPSWKYKRLLFAKAEEQ